MNRQALLAATAVAVLGFVLLTLYIRRFQIEATGGEPVPLLMVVEDVELGEMLSEKMLATRTLPEAYVEERQVKAVDLSRVLGVRVGVALRANQTLLWTDLSTAERQTISLADRIRKGMRAMTVKTDVTSSHSGLLRPGDRVDVLLTSSRSEGSTQMTLPLLQNLLVIAVGGDVGSVFDQVSDGSENRGRAVAVTMAVTLEQAALLAQAEDGGVLRLVLRNEDDLEILEEVPETSDSDVMDSRRRALRQRGRHASRLEKLK